MVSLSLHFQNSANKIDSTLEIRDIAVREGSTGATIIILKEGELYVPSVQPDFLSENPRRIIKIQDTFKLENDDVIAIISADGEWQGFEASMS